MENVSKLKLTSDRKNCKKLRIFGSTTFIIKNENVPEDEVRFVYPNLIQIVKIKRE